MSTEPCRYGCGVTVSTEHAEGGTHYAYHRSQGDTQILASHDDDLRIMVLEQIPNASGDMLNDLIQHTTDRVLKAAAIAELQARTAEKFQADYPDRLAR
jgi:hypothetical protein